MPGMDGPETAERLRQMLPSSRIVGVTGHVDERFTSVGIRAGMDSVIPKPIYIDVLRGLLDM